MLYWSEFEIGDLSLRFESRCIYHFTIEIISYWNSNSITNIIKIKN